MTQNIAKKKYVKPSMEVYELKHQAQLLQGSMPTDPNWPGGVPW
jgi:hypothetical protein